MSLLLAIDGSHLMHRAYFSKSDLTTSYGRRVNGVYNFLNMTFSYIRNHKPTDVIVCWDTRSWRQDSDEDYKASRVKKEDDYIKQIHIVRAGLIAFRIQDVRVDKYEADDLIAHSVNSFNGNSLIVSDDHDFEQLLKEEDKIIRMIKRGDNLYTEKDAREKYGVPTEQLPYLWSLMGDTADEIKGIPKIGKKRGAKLLEDNDFDFAKVFENEKYAEYKERCFMNLELIKLSEINEFPEINTSIQDLLEYHLNTELINLFLEDLEFKSFQRRLEDRSLV